MKKIVSILLALAMTASVISVGFADDTVLSDDNEDIIISDAAAEIDKADDIETVAETSVTYEDNAAVYTFDTATKTITKIELKDPAANYHIVELNIPSAIAGVNVEEIASQACDGTDIQINTFKITIPETMVTIHKNAFYNFSDVYYLYLIMPKTSVYLDRPVFENFDFSYGYYYCYKDSNADYWFSAGNFPDLFDNMQNMRGYTRRYLDYKSKTNAYKTPSVEPNSPVRNTDGTLNCVQLIPYREITPGSVITISITNGKFQISDQALMQEADYRVPKIGDDFDTLFAQIGDVYSEDSIRNVLNRTVKAANSNSMPYKITPIDENTIEVELFPLPDRFIGSYVSDIANGIPTYFISLPAVSGIQQGEIKINIDGGNTNIDSCSFVYGYIGSKPIEFTQNPDIYIDKNVETQPNTQFENAIIIKPTNTISIDDYIEIKIDNGKFDEGLIQNCEYSVPYTGETYDILYNQIKSQPTDDAIKNTLNRTIRAAESNELPYKLTYINSQTLGVTLFPLPGMYANISSSDISEGIPVYSIPLPVIAGSNEGKVLVAVDGKDTTIKNGGWYTAARINTLPEYEQSNLFFMGYTPNVNRGQKLTDYAENALIFRPNREINNNTVLTISIKNGTFDSSLMDICKFHTYYSNLDYDTLYERAGLGGDNTSIENLLRTYLYYERSNELPYKMELLENNKLKVTLFPLPGRYAGISGRITVGIPLYKMRLPIVAGNDLGNVEIAIDSNSGSTVLPSGWYTAAIVTDGAKPPVTENTTQPTTSTSQSTTKESTTTTTEATTTTEPTTTTTEATTTTEPTTTTTEATTTTEPTTTTAETTQASTQAPETQDTTDQNMTESETESSTQVVTESSSQSTTADQNMTESSSESSSEATTEGPSQATTKAPETQDTTASQNVTERPSENTTASATETGTETTTRSSSGGGGGRGPSSGGSGGGGSSSNKTTTEAATETTTAATQSGGSSQNNPSDSKSPVQNIISGDVSVTIGSKILKIGDKEYEIDVAPYIQAQSSSTLVPLRFVAIAIAGGDLEKAQSDKNISWDAATKTATITAGGNTISFKAGSELMYINNNPQVMENGVKAEITNDRMFIPFRALGTAMGVKVDWIADTKTAVYKVK